MKRKIGSKKGVIGLPFGPDFHDKRTLIALSFFFSESSVQGKARGVMKAISLFNMCGSVWGKDSYDRSSPSFASKILYRDKILFGIMEYPFDINRIRCGALIPKADTFLVIIKKSFDLKKFSFIGFDFITGSEVIPKKILLRSRIFEVKLGLLRS